MRNTIKTPPCPRGKKDCPIHEELVALREQVAQLSTQVRTDFLTGLFNKQHLIFTLEQEIERTQRTHQPTTLIVLDGDHFKKINDTHGHVVGDRVIRHLGDIIRDTVRKIDIPCRFGGEEFAIILPSTPLLIGIQVAERLRQRIVNTPLALETGSSLSISVSIGVDTYLQSMVCTPESLLEAADKQLYKAKEEGRNRVCHGEHKISEQTNVTAEEKDALASQLFK